MRILVLGAAVLWGSCCFGAEFARAEGGEGAMVKVVVTTKGVWGDWLSKTLGKVPVGMLESGKVFLGQRATVLVFVGNYGVGAEGAVDLGMVAEFKWPGGKVEQTGELPVFKGKVESAGRILGSATVLNFVPEEKDGEGELEVRMRVRDGVSGELVETVSVVKVEKFAWVEVPEGFEGGRWLTGYYLNPSPELALGGLVKLFEGLKPDALERGWPVVLGFYEELLRGNVWLRGRFVEAYEKASGLERIGLEFVLGFYLRGEKERPEWVGLPLWEDCAGVREFDWDAGRGVVSAFEVDVLWGRFFASGAYEWAKELAGLAKFAGDLGAADRFVAGGGKFPVEVLPADIVREQAVRAMLWSLGNYAGAHGLFKAYVEQFLGAEGKDVGATGQKLLEERLGK